MGSEMCIRDRNYPLVQLLERGTGTFIKGNSSSLSYDKLRTVILEIGGQLSTLGIQSGDSIGIVTPNGPEAATIFIAVASFATAAPLNPSYTKDEFKFYLLRTNNINKRLYSLLSSRLKDQIKQLDF